MHAGLMLCGSKSFKKMIKLQSGIRATLYLCLIFFNVIMVTSINTNRDFFVDKSCIFVGDRMTKMESPNCL